MPVRVFGHIPGYPEGSQFENRAELSEARVYRPLQAGISGSEREGADSIVLSGGYEDDLDFGDQIVYTGRGGGDDETKRQIADQDFRLGKRALAYSSLNGLPVRVIRGEGHNSRYSPKTGYRYDGLYLVDDYWQATGNSGYRIWRYRLIKWPYHLDEKHPAPENLDAYTVAPRQETILLRVVRDPKQAQQIKKLYGYRCQMCGIRLESHAGYYAEAAHIRPLGAPHCGPDTLGNMFCLCPNQHVLFDHGGVIVTLGLLLVGGEGRLTVDQRHRINEDHLRYRQEHYQFDS